MIATDSPRFNRRRHFLSLAALAACWTWAPCAQSQAAAPPPLIDQTLVVWARPANLEQRGAGTLSVLEADAFDSIVLGELRPGVWMRAQGQDAALTSLDVWQMKNIHQ